ncbi:uncharacterized protein PFL1_00059 [Pseudozyma flocculosa PF-1]|uniref:Transmembrane protein n=1 Tax=Pseudozyma flocculosa TaxID=84751 RepID=A0A5C3EUU3_9BASI|nr:uncharacterized protein PFL1_00059 [Pseudozyma flocculosa PF-1]EPQ31860.1 hypothetical protein PFL1_00059 [Pseudozyma flocculosa PF-1]SPO35237.1 uncharacterized protein PSFLO_00708 [Pseudozyma flocculosa]
MKSLRLVLAVFGTLELVAAVSRVEQGGMHPFHVQRLRRSAESQLRVVDRGLEEAGEKAVQGAGELVQEASHGVAQVVRKLGPGASEGEASIADGAKSAVEGVKGKASVPGALERGGQPRNGVQSVADEAKAFKAFAHPPNSLTGSWRNVPPDHVEHPLKPVSLSHEEEQLLLEPGFPKSDDPQPPVKDVASPATERAESNALVKASTETAWRKVERKLFEIVFYSAIALMITGPIVLPAGLILAEYLHYRWKPKKSNDLERRPDDLDVQYWRQRERDARSAQATPSSDGFVPAPASQQSPP